MKEDLKPYKLAQQLRQTVDRCTRINPHPDVALLCEHALSAATWLEAEAEEEAWLCRLEVTGKGGEGDGVTLHPRQPGCKFRAYRRLSAAHSIVLRWGAARHRSWCPVFGHWLWSGRKIHQAVRKDGLRCEWYTGYESVPISQAQDRS